MTAPNPIHASLGDLQVGKTWITVRPFQDDDWNFVFATARPSIQGLFKSRSIGQKWKAACDPVMNTLKPHMRILVASAVDDRTVRLGWGASLGDELVYLYVGRDFRGYGLSRAIRQKLGFP